MLPLLAALCVTAYFGFFIWPGIGGGFMQDDLMNLYRAWTQPLPDLLLDNLIFFRFSPQYRPMGAIFYRATFAVFGFEPRPLHVGCALMLWLSIGLSYLFAREVTGSRQIGLLAALIHSYHGRFAFLIFNSGMCYDILCFLFYFSALTFYVRVRGKGKLLGFWQTAGWCGLFILALDSKEMAVTLPVVVGVYELVYFPPKHWDFRHLVQWATTNGRIALLGGVMTALFIKGRIAAEAGLLRSGAYIPDMTFAVYLDRCRHFLSGMFYEARWLTPQNAAILLAAGLAVALLLRNRAIWLSGALMMIGVLPVAFIERRGLEAVFIPTLGAALFVAILLKAAFDQVWRKPSPVKAIVLFGLTLGTLFAIHYKYAHGDSASFLAEGKQLGLVRDEFRRVVPSLPNGAQILFVRDPFTEYPHGTTFMLRTLHRDPLLIVDRLDLMDFPAIQPDLSRYSRVLSFDGNRLRVCDPADLGLGETQDVQEVRCTPATP